MKELLLQTAVRRIAFRVPGSVRLVAGLAALSLAGLTGCLHDGLFSRSAEDSRPAPVRLTVSVGKMDALSAALGKSSASSLNRLVLVFTSTALDTLRDTITASTTPSLNALSTSAQTINKTYTLAPLRTWKVIATVRDTRDSVTHRDSATAAVVYSPDTLNIPLSLGSRFLAYSASFTIPDSIISTSGTGLKQQLRINRLKVLVDGVTTIDTTRLAYFPSNTSTTLSFNYLRPGSRTIQILAYGPMNAWDVTQPLYAGSQTILLVAGADTTVNFSMAWQGPNTGNRALAVTLARTGSVYGAYALPGTTGLPSALPESDVAGGANNRVVFKSTSTGMIVGDGGVILRTVNAGANWTLVSSNTTQDLYGSVAYTGGGITDYAVGDSGVIIGDSSGVWVSRAGASPTTQSLRAFDYKTNTAWAIGTNGTILTTTTLGNTSPTWTTQSSGTTQTLNSMVAFGTSSAILVGDSGICLRLSGTTWSSVSTGTTQNLNSIQCQSASDCWAVGNGGTIIKYNGTSWSAFTSPTTRNLRDIGQQSTSNVIAVGDSGLSIKWNGTSWSTTASNTTYRLNSVANAAANGAWAVGEQGIIRYSTDGGLTFVGQPVVRSDFYAVHFPSSSRGFAVGAGGTLYRYGTNKAWSVLNSGTSNDLNSIRFADQNNGWAVGAAGTIVRTANGGSGWASQTSGTTSDLTGVQFTSTTYGLVVGAGGTIRKTTDGSTWNTVTSGTTNPLNALFMRSASLAWVVGDSSVANQRGIIRKTTDSGATWTAQTSGTTRALRGIHFVSDSIGYVVGDSGTILKTINGGTTWTKQTTPTSAHLRSVVFADANRGYAVGFEGKVLKTTDGGARWSTVYIGRSPNLYAITLSSATTGWIAGVTSTLFQFSL